MSSMPTYPDATDRTDSVRFSAIEAPRLGEPWLLTPGPLSTSFSVKEAMLKDWGSWDEDFRQLTRELRASLIDMLADRENRYECVPLQGSGSYLVEAMLGTLIPRNGKALVLINGAYGHRIAKTLGYLQREHVTLDKGDYLPPRGDEVAAILSADPAITHVVAVHCETSSGILNPIGEIAQATAAAGRRLLIDSMSAFGAIALDPESVPFDALVSSANKCIEGVPGFGFVLVRRNVLEASAGNCHSLSLDVHDQWITMENTGQWRFTPPTHAVAAFIQALHEHRAEGGVAARQARYTKNRDVLVAGMRTAGFETLLDHHWLSPIIVTFFCPADPAFHFQRFYERMKACGFIIYPGKLTGVDSFRIGCIGRLDAGVMQQVVRAARAALDDLGVSSATPPASALEERANDTNHRLPP